MPPGTAVGETESCPSLNRHHALGKTWSPAKQRDYRSGSQAKTLRHLRTVAVPPATELGTSRQEPEPPSFMLFMVKICLALTPLAPWRLNPPPRAASVTGSAWAKLGETL